MNCEEARGELLGYTAGSLKRRKSTAVERHLEICRECREISASFAEVWQDLGHISCAAPEPLRRRVEQGVREFVSPPAPMAKTLPLWVAGVAACLLLFTGLWLYCRDPGIPGRAAVLHIRAPLPERLTEVGDVRKSLKILLNLESEISVPRDTSLLGYRICRIGEMVVAQVTYQYRGIPVSLFIWDTRWADAHVGLPKDLSRPISFRKRSRSVVVWEHRTLLYCLVADLEPGELAAVYGLPTDAKYSP